VPALNTYASALFPGKVDAAVLILNALLGQGTALAPAFVGLFVAFGAWWGLPVLAGTSLVGLLLLSAGLPIQANASAEHARGSRAGTRWPARFRIYADFALLYGIVETMHGNWMSLYMREGLGATPDLASLALTVFWGTVTAGRLLFAGIEPLDRGWGDRS
jgi:fucose permease